MKAATIVRAWRWALLHRLVRHVAHGIDREAVRASAKPGGDLSERQLGALWEAAATAAWLDDVLTVVRGVAWWGPEADDWVFFGGEPMAENPGNRPAEKAGSTVAQGHG